MPERDLEKELRHELEDAYRRAMASERLNRNPREMEQYCDKLDTQWCEILERERGSELKGAKELAADLILQAEKTSREKDNAQTTKAIKGLDIRTQDKIWHATDRSADRSRMTDREIETAVATVLPSLVAKVNERFDYLKTGMQSAVDQIREGKEPSLEFLQDIVLSRRMEKAKRLDDFLREVNQRDREIER